MSSHFHANRQKPLPKRIGEKLRFFSLLKNKRQNLWQIETADETKVFIYNQCKPKRYL